MISLDTGTSSFAKIFADAEIDIRCHNYLYAVQRVLPIAVNDQIDERICAKANMIVGIALYKQSLLPKYDATYELLESESHKSAAGDLCLPLVQRRSKEKTTRLINSRQSWSLEGNMGTPWEYIGTALRLDETLAKAHYYQGQMLEDDKDYENAFFAYCFAEHYGHDPFYTSLCKNFVDLSFDFSFPARLAQRIDITSARGWLSSEDFFLRFKACAVLISYDLRGLSNPDDRESIESMAGYRLCGCCWIPCTGDSHSAVKGLARRYINSFITY